MSGPTAASELRRGLGRSNLLVGAAAALGLGAATLLATLTGLAPAVVRLGAGTQALAVALALFVIITALHAAAHAYFGWRFGRGIVAAAAGHHARAIRLLAPVERAGMGHYDPGGDARRTLDEARARLR